MAASPPKSPSRLKRKSVVGYFQDLTLEDEFGDKESRLSPSRFSMSTAKSTVDMLLGTIGRSWPPSLRGLQQPDDNVEVPLEPEPEPEPSSRPSLTLRMSDVYRIYGDNWSNDSSIEDKPADVSEDFDFVSQIMDKIHQFLETSRVGAEVVAEFLQEEMVNIIFASNQKARCGLGLDETLKLCMMVFKGEAVEYTNRTDAYQKELEKLVYADTQPGQRHEIRSRAEVIQHAAAFRHIVDVHVHQNKPLSEQLIKDTHSILVRGISGEKAGVFNTRAFGGVYRSQDVYAGNQRCPKPREIPKAMQSLVRNLSKDLKDATRVGKLDPFMIAAKYCDRLVMIHLFLDGNGRMCRLILNTVLIKYAGILVNVGEHDQRRDEYLLVQAESRNVGGHAGPLGTIVLQEASKILRRLRDKLKKHQD